MEMDVIHIFILQLIDKFVLQVLGNMKIPNLKLKQDWIGLQCESLLV